MPELSTVHGASILKAVADTVSEHKQQLSDIDGLIGDGDHGINMSRGFTRAQERLQPADESFAAAFRLLGTTLMNEVGGAMGPLYGTIFRAMAQLADGRETIDAATFAKMLKAALGRVQQMGRAELGDKTLVDVLAPASEAFGSALADGRDFAGALDAMKEAAERGRDATTDMVAKKGRASRLGERSRGVADPGATSCALILGAMADAIKPLLDH